MNWLATGRAAFGVAVLAAPDRLAGDVTGTQLTSQSRTAMRLLGARQLLQAVVCAPAPTRCLLELEAVVDGIHAATMAGVAVVARHRSTRRAAAINVVSALGFLAADVVSAKTMKTTGAQRSPLLSARDRLAQGICRALPITTEG